MLLEVATFSIEAALIAAKAGADRIELCSSPSEGGITPGPGMIYTSRDKVRIPISLMVRPRGGDFLYSDAEFDTMLLDIEIARKAGMDGIVTGILNSEGSIDIERMKSIMIAAAGMEVTFHRAFDMSANLPESLGILIELGINRVLTSGGSRNVTEGKEMLESLARQSAGRISVMPGGGVNLVNLESMHISGLFQEFHLSARQIVPGKMRFIKNNLSMSNNDENAEYNLILPDPSIILAAKRILIK